MASTTAQATGQIIRRGRAAAGKMFPIITPARSDWKIRQVLADVNSDVIRHEAALAGFKGDCDILLCFPRPSPSSPQKNQALGLFYIGEAARQFYGFNVTYWDARHDKEEDFLKLAAKANIIGFSAITGFQLGEFVRLATQVKSQWPERPIILGGAHATLTDAHTNLADPLVDYVVFGEGELRLSALLRAIYKPEHLPAVDGIGYRNKAGGVIIQKSLHVPDLERDLPEVVTDYTLKYFVAAASRNEMILPASRGCPWSTDSCDFCSVGLQYMDSYRRVPFPLWQRAIQKVYDHAPFSHIELEDENSATVIKSAEPIRVLGVPMVDQDEGEEGGQIKLRATHITCLAQHRLEQSKYIRLMMTVKDNTPVPQKHFATLKNILKDHPGEVPAILVICCPNQFVTEIRLPTSLKISPTEDFMHHVQTLLGERCVSLG